MKKCWIFIAFTITTLFANSITGLNYKYGLSFETQVFTGYITHEVSRNGGDNSTWLQYFRSMNTDKGPTFRFAALLDKSILKYMAIEVGASILTTRYEGYKSDLVAYTESFETHYVDIPISCGLMFKVRFNGFMNFFITPTFEVNNQVSTYNYVYDPLLGNTVSKDQSVYDFKPSFVLKSGIELHPEKKKFGVGAFCTYRYYVAKASDITVITPANVNTSFNEKIIYPPFAIGIMGTYYFK